MVAHQVTQGQRAFEPILYAVAHAALRGIRSHHSLAQNGQLATLDQMPKRRAVVLIDVAYRGHEEIMRKPECVQQGNLNVNPSGHPRRLGETGGQAR